LNTTPANRHRLPVLDGLRGVAALLVAFWHMPLALGFQGIVQRPYLAVDFFFCLSGFVVAFAYERRLREGLGLGGFAVARLIRLYPVYLLATVIGLIVLLSTGYPFSSMTFPRARFLLLIVTGFLLLPTHGRPSSALYPLDFPAWSLFYEICANVAYAFLIRRGKASNKTLIATSIASFALLIIWKAQGSLLGAIGWESKLAPFLFGFPRVAFSFVLGVLMLRIYRSDAHGSQRSTIDRISPLGISLLLICTLVAPLSLMRTENFNLLVVALIFPLLVYFGARSHMPKVSDKLCAFLGEASYPFYLLHIFFLQLLSTNFFERYTSSNLQAARTVSVAVIFAALLASYAVARLYDTHVRSWLIRVYNIRISSRSVSTVTGKPSPRAAYD
jgi:peptidoglycan/LPS O-acetylase OafA/YrhL